MKRYLLAFVLFVTSLSVGFGQGEFKVKWNTDFPIQFYVEGTGTINYTWETSNGTPVLSGSGSFTGTSSMSQVILNGVAPSREVIVSIEPSNLLRFRESDCNDPISACNQVDSRLLEVIQWGTTQWTSMEVAFARCWDLQVTAIDQPDLSNVTSLRGMFYDIRRSNPGNFAGLENWDVSNIEDMSALFLNISSGFDLSTLNLSNWDIGNVTDISQGFQGCSNAPSGLENWDVSGVTDMSSLFAACSLFDQNIENWNVSSVVKMSNMFGGASIFNRNLSTWDVSNVTDMAGMFAASGFDQNLSAWDVSNVTDMGGMFWGSSTTPSGLENWDVSSVANMNSMFRSSSIFNSDISMWDVSNVTSMAGMFSDASGFDQNLSQWDLSSISGIGLLGFFNNAALSCQNYSNFLVGQSNNPNLPSGLFLGAFSLLYGNDAIAARNTLINSKGWAFFGDSPSGFNCLSVPLPVELLNFTASNTGQGHQLSWSTASELNNSHFVLEHSMVGNEDSFQELTIVEGKGSTSELSAYGYINKTNVAGTHYYRLKQVDFDGTSSFSDVVALTQGEATEISIYPNPADQSLTLSGILVGEHVMLTDALGRVVFQGTYNGEQLAIGHLPSGTYMVQGEQVGRGYTRRFVKL